MVDDAFYSEFDVRKENVKLGQYQIRYISRFINVVNATYHYMFYSGEYKINVILDLDELYDLADKHELDLDDVILIYLQTNYLLEYG